MQGGNAIPDTVLCARPGHQAGKTHCGGQYCLWAAPPNAVVAPLSRGGQPDAEVRRFSWSQTSCKSGIPPRNAKSCAFASVQFQFHFHLCGRTSEPLAESTTTTSHTTETTSTKHLEGVTINVEDPVLNALVRSFLC